MRRAAPIWGTEARGPLRAFSYPHFGRVWTASVVFAVAAWGERLAAGWLILDQSDSVFLTAAAFAARQAPGLVVAPIAGAISDRVPRGRLLLATGAYKAITLTGLAILAAGSMESLWPAFVVIALSGVGQSFEIPSMQGLVTDTVPRTGRMNAIAIQSIGVRAFSAVGGLAGGLLVGAYGVPVALYAAAGTFFVGGLVASTVQTSRHGAEGSPVSIWRDTLDGLRLITGIPIIRTLLIAAVLVEMFGFAYNAVLPAVARDALDLDVERLGVLQMMAGIGSVLGAAILTTLGDFRRKGLLLLGIAIGYGAFIATFSVSGVAVVALVMIVGVGAMAAGFDAMQWILLQANVPERMRGRAIGGWVFAIGFGWIGHLGLGALGELIGIQMALMGAGSLVILTAVLAFARSRGLREA